MGESEASIFSSFLWSHLKIFARLYLISFSFFYTSYSLIFCIFSGAGEPNFDSFESNPFQNTKQRQEQEIQTLMQKLSHEMIGLDASFVGSLDKGIFYWLISLFTINLGRRALTISHLNISYVKFIYTSLFLMLNWQKKKC